MKNQSATDKIILDFAFICILICHTFSQEIIYRAGLSQSAALFQLSFHFSSFLPLFSLSVPLLSIPFPPPAIGVWHRKRYDRIFGWA